MSSKQKCKKEKRKSMGCGYELETVQPVQVVLAGVEAPPEDDGIIISRYIQRRPASQYKRYSLPAAVFSGHVALPYQSRDLTHRNMSFPADNNALVKRTICVDDCVIQVNLDNVDLTRGRCNLYTSSRFIVQCI